MQLKHGGICVTLYLKIIILCFSSTPSQTLLKIVSNCCATAGDETNSCMQQFACLPHRFFAGDVLFPTEVARQEKMRKNGWIYRGIVSVSGGGLGVCD